MSVFFNQTCKALGIRRARANLYHPSSNGMVERLHRSLHAGLFHYVNSTHTNWDEVPPFFLMAYRATPNVTTRYSPFFLLHGREMTLPSNEELKAKVGSTDLNIKQRIDNLRTSLKLWTKRARSRAIEIRDPMTDAQNRAALRRETTSISIIPLGICVMSMLKNLRLLYQKYYFPRVQLSADMRSFCAYRLFIKRRWF